MAHPDAELAPQSLADKRADASLVSVDEDIGLALVDASSPELSYLRRKIEQFADDEKVREGRRRNETAIAPIQEIRLATVEDRAGPRLRSQPPEPNVPRWFELACRGGTRVETAETERSRLEVQRVLALLSVPMPQEFIATERLLLFARLTLGQLRQLVAATDCIYEVDLAPPDIRGWLLINDDAYPIASLQEFEVRPPADDASAVVILDTGIAREHPLLRPAVLAAHSVVPGDDSAADEQGHGTGMAGIALYDDVGEVVEQGAAVTSHWLESVKILRHDASGSAADEQRLFWPAITQAAVHAAEAGGDRRRVYALAVSAPLEEPRGPTTWSHAIDQLVFNEGRGRLVFVAVGNVQPINKALTDAYPGLNLVHYLDDPSQATNAISVGAYTRKRHLPPDPTWRSYRALAPEGGVAPCTRSGLRGSESDGVKPDIVFEGGNFAVDNLGPLSDIESLCEVTTGRAFLQHPLVTLSETSCATAHAARFGAQLWNAVPHVRPETIRGLIVHSAEWTDAMKAQLPRIDERLSLCGWGVPSLAFASECVRSRATILVEDAMASAVWDETDPGHPRKRREAKFFRLPIPEGILLDVPEAELRVTLSYFPEPNTFGRKQYRGLDLAWDMQGPTEDASEFSSRINRLQREPGYERTSTSFGWSIGKQRRSRGTVQSDRWIGPGAFLARPRWIAVYPVLGWWDKRGLDYSSMPFSLIVTVSAPGVDIYTPVQVHLQAEVEVTEVEIES